MDPGIVNKCKKCESNYITEDKKFSIKTITHQFQIITLFIVAKGGFNYCLKCTFETQLSTENLNEIFKHSSEVKYVLAVGYPYSFKNDHDKLCSFEYCKSLAIKRCMKCHLLFHKEHMSQKDKITFKRYVRLVDGDDKITPVETFMRCDELCVPCVDKIISNVNAVSSSKFYIFKTMEAYNAFLTSNAEH